MNGSDEELTPSQGRVFGVNLRRELISPDYLLEACVIFVWATTIMPWSVVYSPLQGGITAVFIRYPLLEIRYVLSTNLPTQFYTPWGGYQLHATAGDPIALGYVVWMLGGLLFAVAFLMTIVLFLREEALTSASPVPLPRLFGGLLVGSGGLLAISTGVFVLRGFGGIPIPLGLIFMLLFGVALLVNPLETESEDIDDEAETAAGA